MSFQEFKVSRFFSNIPLLPYPSLFTYYHHYHQHLHHHYCLLYTIFIIISVIIYVILINFTIRFIITIIRIIITIITIIIIIILIIKMLFLYPPLISLCTIFFSSHLMPTASSARGDESIIFTRPGLTIVSSPCSCP